MRAVNANDQSDTTALTLALALLGYAVFGHVDVYNCCWSAHACYLSWHAQVAHTAN